MSKCVLTKKQAYLDSKNMLAFSIPYCRKEKHNQPLQTNIRSSQLIATHYNTAIEEIKINKKEDVLLEHPLFI